MKGGTMLPTLTKALRDEIKAAIVAKVITDGNTVLKEIEELPSWIENQVKRMNMWEVAAFTVQEKICANVVCDIEDKFNQIANLFIGLSAEHYFKEKTEQIIDEFHAELLVVEKEYVKNIYHPAWDWTSATYPYLAKFIYGYRHLAWQIYSVSQNYY